MSAEAPIEPAVVSDQATTAATIEPIEAVEPPAPTTTTMAVNIFTRRQIFSILRSLGNVDPDEENLRYLGYPRLYPESPPFAIRQTSEISAPQIEKAPE